MRCYHMYEKFIMVTGNVHLVLPCNRYLDMFGVHVSRTQSYPNVIGSAGPPLEVYCGQISTACKRHLYRFGKIKKEIGRVRGASTSASKLLRWL